MTKLLPVGTYKPLGQLPQLPTMALLIPFTTLSVLAVLYAIYRRLTRISIAHIPGPPPESFLLGISFHLSRLIRGLPSPPQAIYVNSSKVRPRR